MGRITLCCALFLALPVALHAEELRGCDKFKWSIAAEQALLAAAKPAGTAPLNRDSGEAYAVTLAPFSEAHFVVPPERAPKQAMSFGGVLSFASAQRGGEYRITLSAAAWIDVVQDGKYLSPTTFTGALDCPMVRKSVQFAIAPGPFTLQLSDAASETIGLVITRAK